jgi:hypothetical protein
MTPRKYNNPPPAKSEGPPPPSRDSSGNPLVLNPADEVMILTAPRLPRLWLRVVLTLAPDADLARTALAAAGFVGRACAIDKRLRMTIDSEKSTADNGELVLVFALGRWGTLEAGWLEEAKPLVRELASAFDGAAVKGVEIISE